MMPIKYPLDAKAEMQSFFYVCPVEPDFTVLCTPRQGADALVLHECVACNCVHQLDSLTGRVLSTSRLSAVAVRKVAQEA